MPQARVQGTLERSTWYDRLTAAVDCGIASTVLIAPLFMGGRGPVGRFVLVLLVSITALLWCVRQCLNSEAVWRKSGAEVLLLAGLGFLLLQLAPLPESILSLLSTHVSELLPLWTSASEATVQLGLWDHASLHPMATQSGLATYVAYAMLFLVTFQRLEQVRDVQRLLRLIAVATCLLAIVGLTQFLFGNGKFLWVFEHVSRDTSHAVKGPLQNQNHFAHLMALGIGPLLWWLSSMQAATTRHVEQRGFNRVQDSAKYSQVLWIALGVVTFAALLTFSRGGVIATILSSSVCVTLLCWKQLLPRRVVSVVAVIACLMVVSLSIHGYEPLARKLGTLQESQSIDQLSHARWSLWKSHFQAIPDFWLLGSGVGTHRDIYPTYLSEHFDAEFTHGECGYLQLLLETGIVGAGLFLAGLIIAFRWALVPILHSRNREVIACAAAIVPGLLASVVHSFGDFVWYIPACMTTTVLLLAAACHTFHAAVSTQGTDTPTPANVALRPFAAPRLAWIGAAIVCTLTSAVATRHLLGPATAASALYEYQRLAKSTGISDWQPTTLEDMAAMSSLLETVVDKSPNDARAQSHLAGLYLQQFDLAQQRAQNPMPLTQIRDAALASNFGSKKELDNWLDRAVGENRHFFDAALRHAHQSVRICPLEGEAYALLARVAFLEGPDANRKREYIQQALRVRPFHSRVQFVAGQDALLAGDVETAISYWKKAFHGERGVQNELVRELTAVIPAQQLLDTFVPDQRGLEALFNHYQRASETDSAKIVATYYTSYLSEHIQNESELNELATLTKLSSLHEYLGHTGEAIRFAKDAEALAPSDFALKLRLGKLLVASNQFVEAQAALKWCARRQPDHHEVHDLLSTANRGSVLRQADASGLPQEIPQFRQ
ncbi:MAG: O-antigen ligase family protein [Planctomycetaceae bacterium]|nr:O-antigen ligase family protein [Planctomycetales bacterium]MCB9920675.1 O-antigen ligase family protein [Planctomycetaceae bacterium]